jgi:hypothetical protein
MALAATISHPLLRDVFPPEAPDSFYAGFNPSVQVLPKGHKRYPRSRPFPVATIYERDVEIPMRDGTKLRADIFRPEDTGSVPAILPWSPYGKTGTGTQYPSRMAPRLVADERIGSARLEMIPAHIGIPFDWLSDYEKFEAPDPAEWVGRGYAVVNIDARGSWDSEGNLLYVHIRPNVDYFLTSTVGLGHQKGKMDTMLLNTLPHFLGVTEASVWRAIHGLELLNGSLLQSNRLH